jgi:hypothetical protein
MSDEAREPIGPNNPPAIAPVTAPAQNVRVDVNATALATNYSNFFRVTGTFEELILDFGLHTGAILPTGPEAVKLGQRIVLTFPTAKRLLAALQLAIARHEQVFGTIEVDPQKRMKREPRS